MIRLSSPDISQLIPPRRGAFYQAFHKNYKDRIQMLIQIGIQSADLHQIDSSVADWNLLGMKYPHFSPVHSSDVLPSDDSPELLVGILLDGSAR